MKLLMLSDIFVLTGFGLIQPILAIYVNQDIVGGSVLTAGIASAIFMLTKSLVQLPFSKYLDTHGRKAKWLIFGTLLMALVPLIYLTSRSIYQVFLAELIYGIGSGLAYPTWLGLWSVNLEKGKESFQWSLYSTSTGIGTAATGAAGAVIADLSGFTATFLLAGLMCALGCLLLFHLESKMAEKIEVQYRSKQRNSVQGPLADSLKL